MIAWWWLIPGFCVGGLFGLLTSALLRAAALGGAEPLDEWERRLRGDG